MSNQELLHSLLRQDFVAFVEKAFVTLMPGATYVPNWHIEAMADQLMRCLQGETKRLIITLPPRNLKSICASVALPAWVLGHMPYRSIIGISYAQDLAEKHSLDCRRVMEEPWYKEVFPATRLSPTKNTASDFVTTKNGGRLATSVGGSLTGRGADIIIIDDFHKADEALSDTKRKSALDWYQNTVPSRLNDKNNGIIIVVQQRLHEEDLVGHLLNQGGWTHLNLPAIAQESADIPIGPGKVYHRQAGDLLHPARESQAILDEFQKTMGSYAFAAQYQQNPVPLGGGIVKSKWFKTFDENNLYKQKDNMIVQSWDTAMSASESADYSVCTTWLVTPTKAHLIHVFRQRLEYPELKPQVEALAAMWGADLVIIEYNPCSDALILTLKREGRINIKWWQPDADKVARMVRETPAIEAGEILLPANAPWLADFRHEIVRFPKGAHDDQVDSLSQFLFWRRNFWSPYQRQESTLTITVSAAYDMPDLDLGALY